MAEGMRDTKPLVSDTHRRFDIFPIVLGPVVLALIVFYAIDRWPVSIQEMTFVFFLVAVFIICFLWGPTAYVKVTATEIVIANEFVLYQVPRGMIREVTGWDFLDVAIYPMDGRRISISAFNPGLNPNTQPHQKYRRRAKALERMLQEVPAIDAGGAVQRRFRKVNVGLGLIASALLVRALLAIPDMV